MKSVAFCGSSVTPFSWKNSSMVPEVAGARGGSTGAAACAAGAGSAACAAGAGSAACAAGAGSATASGVTVTVWVTVAVAAAVAGAGGSGVVGSAEALAPVNPITAIDPAATPPTSTRH